MTAMLLCFDSGRGGSVLLRIAMEDLVQLTGMSPALAGRDSTNGLSGYLLALHSIVGCERLAARD